MCFVYASSKLTISAADKCVHNALFQLTHLVASPRCLSRAPQISRSNLRENHQDKAQVPWEKKERKKERKKEGRKKGRKKEYVSKSVLISFLGK